MSDTDPALPELVDLEEVTVAIIRAELSPEQLGPFFDVAFGELAKTISGQGIEVTGPAFAHYFARPSLKAKVEVGFPVASPVTAEGHVEPGTLPAGRAARTIHAGGFDTLGASWGALHRWIVDEGHQPAKEYWESYITQPHPDMDPADLRTELTWPLAD